jgi:hypothetical protein
MKYVEACEAQDWHLQIWPTETLPDGEIISKEDQSIFVPFKCRSWRHPGPCREWKGAQDFARIRAAMLDSQYWTHIVLTFRHGKGEPRDADFRRGLACWAKLRKRLVRSFRPMVYIQTWEIHTTLWPHAHVAINSRRLSDACHWSPKENWIRLIEHKAAECGFGYVGWCEPLRDEEAMAGYFTKLARELTDGGRKCQIPINAPPHFRRLRASAGVLPAPYKNPDYTGLLHFYELAADEDKKKGGQG